MGLISSSLTEVPVGGVSDAQVALAITPPVDGYVVSDRWQQIVNNGVVNGVIKPPGSYANGFRGKPVHYFSTSLPVNGAPPDATILQVTLNDPFAQTISNNGVFPLGYTLPGKFLVKKGVPFYAVWMNPDSESTLNWSAMDFLKGDPAQVSDIQFLWRWRGSNGVYVPWTSKDAAGDEMQVIPSPYNYTLDDGTTIGYNGVEVSGGVVVDGPAYGFRASVS